MISLFRFVFTLLNLAAALLLLLCYAAQYVSPAWHWLSGLMGLAYPVLLLLNVFFVLSWALLHRKRFLLSLICILAGWGLLAKYVQMPAFVSPPAKITDTSLLRVMTYNVHGFLDPASMRNTLNDIRSGIHAQQPDVLCLQEAVFWHATSLVSGYKAAADLSGIVCDTSPERISQHVHGLIARSGVVIVSRYPIIDRGVFRFPESTNISVYADIVKGRDTVRIYNCHLHSFALQRADTDLLDKMTLREVEAGSDVLIRIGRRLKDGFARRSFQANELAVHIRQSPYPVIVCGDFNDVPSSYAYRKIAGGLDDAFSAAGRGWGGTYMFRGFYPVRIDYILYHPRYRAVHYQSPRLKLSDHEPVAVQLETR